MLQAIKRKLTQYPLTLRFIGWIVLPVLVIVVFAYASLKQGLPADQITLSGMGLHAPVSIVRDAQGVPHIAAQTDNDAYFAVGYVHAQDRLWQLETQRRLIQGRLSEIFGKESVPQDAWFRTLGLTAAAKSAWPALSKEAQGAITAYTAGVNAAMAAQRSLPPEFRILSITPQPWTEIDTLACIKLLAFELGGNYRREIARFIVRQSLPPEQSLSFFPDTSNTVAGPALPATAASDSQGLKDFVNFQKHLELDWKMGGRAVGSNVWAVAGKHTADGAALLANDPHLGLQIPSVWYAVSAKGGALNVAGMTLIGVPLVIFGHNEQIAWGGTNMMADAQDLYFENTKDQDPHRYLANGKELAFEERTEYIAIRPDFPEALHKQYEPMPLHIRTTRHGPVISDQFQVFDHPLSLRWTALDAGDTSFEAFFRLAYARDWPGFENAMHRLVAPALNMVYADRAGNIGHLGAGRIPIRKQGNGSLPSSCWIEESVWSGFVAPERMPRSYNPPSGLIVNANDKIGAPDDTLFISQDWASPARAQRIRQMLDEKVASGKPLALADMQVIQGDLVDLEARALVAALARFAPQGADQERAWSYVKGWRGDMGADSQPAAIFHVWMRHFRDRLFTARLKDTWRNPAQKRFVDELADDVSLDTLKTIVSQPGSPWCTAASQAGAMPCQAELGGALQEAIDELLKLKGDRSMESWKWGQLHKTVYTHLPFSAIKPFDKVFESRLANGGSVNTVNVAASTYRDNEGYLQYLGVSFRQVFSLNGQQITHRYMNSTGQSGNLASPHYADMVQPMRDLRYFALQSDADARKRDAATAAPQVATASPAGNNGTASTGKTRTPGAPQ